MRKIILATFMVLALGVSVLVVIKYFSEDVASAGSEISERAAEILQTKIDRIKQADPETVQAEADVPAAPSPASANPAPAEPAAPASSVPEDRPLENVEISEEELEAYVLVFLRERIPAQMDAMDVQLTSGAVAADTQLTFNSNSTGNPIVDALIGGTHNLFVKGRLSGLERRGQFELEEIRIDGIPVPKVLVETLFDKYVKPTYPEADLDEAFELPWGIDSLMLEPGKALVAY